MFSSELKVGGERGLFGKRGAKVDYIRLGGDISLGIAEDVTRR